MRRVDVGVLEARRDGAAAQLDVTRVRGPMSGSAHRGRRRRRRSGRRFTARASAQVFAASAVKMRPPVRTRSACVVFGMARRMPPGPGPQAACPAGQVDACRVGRVGRVRRAPLPCAHDDRASAPRRLRGRPRRLVHRPRPRRGRPDRRGSRDGRAAVADPRPAPGAGRRTRGGHPRVPEPPSPGPHGQHRAVPQRGGRGLLGPLHATTCGWTTTATATASPEQPAVAHPGPHRGGRDARRRRPRRASTR